MTPHVKTRSKKKGKYMGKGKKTRSLHGGKKKIKYYSKGEGFSARRVIALDNHL